MLSLFVLFTSKKGGKPEGGETARYKMLKQKQESFTKNLKQYVNKDINGGKYASSLKVRNENCENRKKKQVPTRIQNQLVAPPSYSAGGRVRSTLLGQIHLAGPSGKFFDFSEKVPFSFFSSILEEDFFLFGKV